MKKFVLVLLAGLFLGACAQKTCPTYSFNELEAPVEQCIAIV